MLPFGRTTLWHKCKNGKFPKLQRLNASVTVWRNDEVNEWLANPTTWENFA
ncbi:helix-turn-helix transcriptional regulator [Moraxella nonliquefaciens]|uniref:helix-turn-helix transcriptional regulator n=1 Tax=Moraxella nonliquefaciens TaxID=478 RepID=UPI0020A4286F|nr:AlpA family phage regulatory protein [Moraxella nonliquefaciens]